MSHCWLQHLAPVYLSSLKSALPTTPPTSRPAHHTNSEASVEGLGSGLGLGLGLGIGLGLGLGLCISLLRHAEWPASSPRALQPHQPFPGSSHGRSLAQAERFSCWAPQPAGHTSLKRQPTLLSKIFRCPGRRAVGIFTGTEVDGHVERLPASHLLSGRKASGVQGVKNDSLKQGCH